MRLHNVMATSCTTTKVVRVGLFLFFFRKNKSFNVCFEDNSELKYVKAFSFSLIIQINIKIWEREIKWNGRAFSQPWGNKNYM